MAGVGAGVQVGPVKIKAEANAVKVTGSVTDDGGQIKAEVIQAKGSASFGEATAQAQGALVTVKGSESGIEVQGPTGSAKANVGDNGANLSLSNSTTVAVQANVGPLKVKAGVNLFKLATGVSDVISGGMRHLGNQIKKNILKESER